MADRTTTQPPEPGVGPPPREAGRSTDILLIEVAKLQSDAEYLKRDLGETRADMKDIRERMAKLEVRVDHLPTKGFIVAAVITSLTIVGGLLTVAPLLQKFAGTAVANRASIQPTPLPAPSRPN